MEATGAAAQSDKLGYARLTDPTARLAYALVALFVFLANPFNPRKRILHIAKNGVRFLQISVDVVHRGLCALYLLCVLPTTNRGDCFGSVQPIPEQHSVPP